MPTPGTVQLVTVASGVPTVGSGTVSTLDNIFNATNGPVDVKAASTLPAATDKALVATIRDPITIVSSQLSPLGQAAASASTCSRRSVCDRRPAPLAAILNRKRRNASPDSGACGVALK